MLASLARLMYRRRRRVLVGAVLFVVLRRGGRRTGRRPARLRRRLRPARRRGGAGARGDRARDRRVRVAGHRRARASRRAGRLRTGRRPSCGASCARPQGPEVASAVAYEPGGSEELVSQDRRSSYVAVTLHDGADADPVIDRMEDLPHVALGGPEVVGEQAGTQVQEDLARAELLAFPLLFLVSLLVFRGLVAALLPLARRDDHRADDVPADPRGQRDRADVGVRAQPDHRARPRPGDRLLAVHGVALPRGARAAASTPRRRSSPRCARPAARSCSARRRSPRRSRRCSCSRSASSTRWGSAASS